MIHTPFETFLLFQFTTYCVPNWRITTCMCAPISVASTWQRCTNHANLRVAVWHSLPFYFLNIRFFTACSWRKNTSLEANNDAGIYLNIWRRRWHFMLFGVIVLSWLGPCLKIIWRWEWKRRNAFPTLGTCLERLCRWRCDASGHVTLGVRLTLLLIGRRPAVPLPLRCHVISDAEC